MPSVSEEPGAPDVLTSSSTSAGAGSSASAVQESTSEPVQAPAGLAIECQPDQETPAGERVGAHEGDQKEAIIAILEDWAAWERAVEEEADQIDTEPAAKELPVATVADKPVAALAGNDIAAPQQHTNSNAQIAKNCAVAEFTDDATPAVDAAPTPNKSKVLSATYSGGGSSQLLYTSRRERRRAERHDPAARARRRALKVWAADQTRRRSSAEESTVSESLRQQGWGGGLKEWATMNARSSRRSSRRSSADVTVDHNRRSSANEWFRAKKPPPGGFAPREMSVQRPARNLVDLGPGPQQSPRTAVARRSKQQAAGRKGGLNSYPWRANMKTPEKRGGGRNAFDTLREGDTPTAPSTPRSPAAGASPSSSMIAGRGSPWARSPSRETAGGILVKHCFFYGSSSKATSRGAAAATTSPSFESPWMRQFREEVQSNPNWWVGSDRFVPGRAATPHSGNFLGGGKGSSGKSARPTMSTGLTPRGKKGRRADRATDLWREVRSLLASGRHGGAKVPWGGALGREHSEDGGGTTPGRVDLLSFGDRLRYTPLSQGDWVVGRAAAAAAAAGAAGSAAEQPPKSVVSLPEGSRIAIPAAEVVGATVAEKTVEEKQGGNNEAGVGNIGPGQAPASGNATLREKGEGASDCNDRSRAGTRSSWQDLQSIHAVTLAKLRGEIDPFTREELVLRAAEEARGALARDRARSTSPRRASAGVFHSSGKGRKRGSVPDSIDYDKVEATLSLIELATRAAGPDAGKQMLQALEGLDRIHQRVSDEKDAAEEDPEGCDGEDVSTSINGAERGNESGGAKVAGAAGPTTAANASNSNGRPGDSLVTAEMLPTTADEEHFADTTVEDETNSATPERLSRKLSLAVSSSSEESAGSEASVGMMQTIGNWLWSNTSPTPSRRNSQSSNVEAADGDDDEKEQESGRSEFPLTLEGSGANDYLETNGVAEEAVSDYKKDGQDGLTESRVCSSVSGQQGREAAEKPSRSLVLATENSGAAESTPADLDRYVAPTEIRATSSVSGRQSRQAGEPANLQHIATGTAGVKESSLHKQATQENSLDKPLSVRTRRNSETDKPSSLPHLAAEIARAAEIIPDGGDLHRGTAVPDGEQEERNNSRRETAHGTLSTDHTTPSKPSPASQVGFEDIPRGDSGREYCFRTATPEKGGAHTLATETESCSKEKAGELRHRMMATVKGDTAGAEDKREAMGTNSRASALLHRDSWVSVGTRPRRGNNNVSVKEPTVAGEKDDSSPTTISAGRDEASTLSTREVAVSGGGPLTNNKGVTGTKSPTGGRWVSPKVCTEFVWPRPGRVCNPKRLRPPGKSKDNTTSTLPRGAPGIVRRSPLIDALHPEVARQREFQLQLRQTRQREAPPSSTKPEDIKEVASFVPEVAAAKCVNAEKIVSRAAATAKANAAHAADDATGKGKSSRHAAVATAATAVRLSPATTGGAKARRRSRSRWSDPAPLPVPPLSVTPLPVPPCPTRKPSRPSLDLTGTGTAAVGEGSTMSRPFADGTDVTARAGRLTVQQWESVEAWMARARRSLGPKVWACLGSSDAFHRTRSHIRLSIGSGDGARQEQPEIGGATPSPADTSLPPPCCSTQAVPERGTNKERQAGRRKTGLQQAQKGVTPDVSRKKQKQDKEEGFVGGWDQHLSEKAALAIDAVMWAIATERERTITCATIAQGKNRKQSGEDKNAAAGATALQRAAKGRGKGRPRGEDTGDSNPAKKAAAAAAALAAVEELRISMPTARRFIKSSLLIDGISVLDADVDLAFKRWEEVGRLARRDEHRSSSAASAESGGECTVGRTAKGKVEAAFDDAAAMPLLQRLCEAVGCSDPARYGDIHPMAKARLCRKHRRNGMVDVGSRRCERPDCGRLAVGASANFSAGSGALCTLHAREGRVDVEGFAFVLLALSGARHTRIRRPTARTANTVSAEEEASSARSGELTGRDSTVLHAVAVRNVLLALTNQPLVPGSPTAGRDFSPAASQGSTFLDPCENSDVEPVNGEPFDERIARSTDSVRERPAAVGRSAAATAASRDSALRRHRQYVGRRHSSRCSSDDLGGSQSSTRSGALEAAGRPRRRSSPPVTFAVSGSPRSLAESPEEGEDEDSSSCRHGERWQSRTSERTEEDARSADEGGRLVGGARGVPEEVVNERKEGKEEFLDWGARRGQAKNNPCANLHGGSDDGGLNDDQQIRSPGGWSGGAGRGGLAQSCDAAVGMDVRRDGARRSGVDEVLEKNATPLQAMFHKYSRQPAGCTSGVTMTLPDILRFCDAFELRPGLVSTREIVDAYKEVAYPGVVGLTDGEVGYSSTNEISDISNTAGLSASKLPRQATSSSENTSSHGGRATDPSFSEGKGGSEPLAPNLTTLPDAPLQDDAALEDKTMEGMTLEDLAKATDTAVVAERRRTGQEENSQVLEGQGGSSSAGTAQREGSRTPTEGGNRIGQEDIGGTTTLKAEAMRRGSVAQRGIGQRENSRRGAGSRRGTTQQEDDECSLYFRSGSVCEGHRMTSPSRRTSTSSSSGVGGKGKRTVYLGRGQAFPLRRVESSLAVDARGFGLSGVSPGIAVGGVSRRRGSTPGSSMSGLNPSGRRTSAANGEGGGQDFHSSGGDAAFGTAAKGSSTVAPGLTEPQFFEWLSEIAVECKALTTKKTFGHSLTRPRSKMGRRGEGYGGKAESGCSVHSASARRQNAARAVVLLQWMEVSRGMRTGKKGGIPPFRLSSCLANGKPLTP